ncbi:dynein heavy chain 1 cytosolic, partial [Clonorchis sinensis]
MADPGGDAPPVPAQPTATLADPSALSQYLFKAVSCILEDDDDGAVVLRSVLEDPTGRDAIKKFISDPQIHSLIVQKLSNKGECGGS